MSTKKKAPTPPAKVKHAATKKAKPVVTAKKAPEPEPEPDIKLADRLSDVTLAITPVQAGYSEADDALLMVANGNETANGYDFYEPELLAMLDPLHVESNPQIASIGGIAARLTPRGLQRVKYILEVRAAQPTPPASFLTQNKMLVHEPDYSRTDIPLYQFSGLDLYAKDIANGVTLSVTVKETMNQTKFAIEDVPMPDVLKLKRIVTARYPFGALNVGQSFFVSNTEERPNAVKSMTSNVANANRKFKPARFRMVPEPNGVRVFRTE